jgi:hypothetical protein
MQYMANKNLAMLSMEHYLGSHKIDQNNDALFICLYIMVVIKQRYPGNIVNTLVLKFKEPTYDSG